MATARDNLARKQFFIPATQPEEEIVLRVAAYCRVSTDSEDQINSFTAQNNHYTEMITAHDQWELVDIYADEGITGTSTKKRKDFQRLLADCRKGRIDKVLVKSISRFARNTTECLETIRELKSLSISIYFEEHNIDTKMVSSEMLTAVIASCAQAESESISRNMRWSVQKRMENGTFNTCRAATGFQLSENGLKVAQEEATVIYGIFEEYLKGKNSREIAARLNEEAALGRAWNRKLVDYILTNERYAGNALLQKKYRTDSFPRMKKPNRGERPMYYVRNSNPAIIPQEMFDQAAHLRSSRRVEMSDTDVRPFSKKLYCGRCGSLCRSKKTNDVWYWVCRRHEEDIAQCDMPPVPEDAITAAFLRLYYNLKYNHEVLSYHMKQMAEVRKRRMLWSPAAVELNREISDILSQSHALALLNRQGLVDPDIFISKSNQLAEQLRNAKQQKEKLRDMEYDQSIDATQQLQETLLTGPEILDTFDGELFCELIDRIILQSNTKIRFRLKTDWNCRNPLKGRSGKVGTKRKLPFGYKMESGRVVIDSTERSWVLHLFSRYNMGIGIRELTEFMNNTAVSYDPGKPWNKNMVARILADTRYLGDSGFPVLIDAAVFLDAEGRRKKKAPPVQKTDAQTVLRRKCGCRITPHIEHEVLYLLNCLARNPERIVTPQTLRGHSQRLDTLKAELEELICELPVNEKRAREVLQEIAAEMYSDIDPREYETQRMRRAFQKEEPRTELDANLIAMNISAVLVDSNGKVKIRLKNDQIMERGE